MAKECKAAGCCSFVWGGGYCNRHQYLREDLKERKKAANGRKVLKKKALVKKFHSLPNDLRRRSNLMARAVYLFHKYVKLRDQNRSCISCPNGKVEEAGHYFSAGKYPGLKFDVVNTNGQCHECNCHKEGNLEEYRNGLISKYGEEKVSELENIAAKQRGVYKWDDDQLQALIIRFNRYLKRFK